MSLSSEWLLAIHRAIWFPVLYAIGLEGEAVAVYPTDGDFTAKLAPVLARRGRKASGVPGYAETRKKAA